MDEASFTIFECHLYVSPRGRMDFRLPAESGPKRVAKIEPIDHEQLIDPRFRRLLAALESIDSANTLPARAL